MSAIQDEEAVRRALGLVNLFERRMITEGSLVSGIAGLVTAENFQRVMETLPENARAHMRRWVGTLRDERPGEIVFWPLARGVELSFKEWLRQQESNGNGTTAG